METYCGIPFETSSDGWLIGSRTFPYLPSNQDGLGGVQIDHNFKLVTPSKIWTPTNGQLQALQYFLDHEESICNRILETACRYLSALREAEEFDPSRFEDIPDNPTTGDMQKLLSFSGMNVIPENEYDSSLIGMGFVCEWEDEHGFGVVLADGIVVDIGSMDICSQPEGTMIPPNVFTAEQQAKSDAVFGVGASRSFQVDFQQRKARQRETNEETEYWNRGFPSVDALKEVMETSEPWGVRVTLDVPENTTSKTGSNKSLGTVMKEVVGKMMISPEMVSKTDLPAGPKKILKAIHGMLFGMPPPSGSILDDGYSQTQIKRVEKIRSRMLSFFTGFESKSGMPPEDGDYTSVEILFPLKMTDSKFLSDEQSGLELAVWNSEGDQKEHLIEGGAWPGVLMEISKKWPGSVPRGGSVRMIDNGQEVEANGNQLGPALLMALCEVLGADAEKALQDYYKAHENS